MNGEVYTYSPDKVKIALGSHIMSGYADDSFINIEPAGDGTTTKFGCDGTVNRSINIVNAYTMKISLLQNSPTNHFLRKRYEMDQKDGNGVFPVTVKDLMGAEQFTSPIAWVKKPAAWGRGKESGNREWEITCANGSFADEEG